MEEVIEPMPRAFVQQPSAVAQAVIPIETAPSFWDSSYYLPTAIAIVTKPQFHAFSAHKNSVWICYDTEQKRVELLEPQKRIELRIAFKTSWNLARLPFVRNSLKARALKVGSYFCCRKQSASGRSQLGFFESWQIKSMMTLWHALSVFLWATFQHHFGPHLSIMSRTGM